MHTSESPVDQDAGFSAYPVGRFQVCVHIHPDTVPPSPGLLAGTLAAYWPQEPGGGYKRYIDRLCHWQTLRSLALLGWIARAGLPAGADLAAIRTPVRKGQRHLRAFDDDFTAVQERLTAQVAAAPDTVLDLFANLFDLRFSFAPPIDAYSVGRYLGGSALAPAAFADDREAVRFGAAVAASMVSTWYAEESLRSGLAAALAAHEALTTWVETSVSAAPAPVPHPGPRFDYWVVDPPSPDLAVPDWLAALLARRRATPPEPE